MSKDGSHMQQPRGMNNDRLTIEAQQQQKFDEQQERRRQQMSVDVSRMGAQMDHHYILKAVIISGFPAGLDFSSFRVKSYSTTSRLQMEKEHVVKFGALKCAVIGYDHEERIATLKIVTNIAKQCYTKQNYEPE
jgi:hypothetical protein